MKSQLYIVLLFFWTNCKAQDQLKLNYEDFGISFYPTKCIDTLDFKITKGEFENCNAKIFLEDCNGKNKFTITNKNNTTLLTGYYANAIDTLAVYNNAKIMGKASQGQYYYQVRVLKYFSPLHTGVWTYYNKKGEKTDQIEYHFERPKSN